MYTRTLALLRCSNRHLKTTSLWCSSQNHHRTSSNHDTHDNLATLRNVVVGSLVTSWFFYELYERQEKKVHLKGLLQTPKLPNRAGTFDPNLPNYTLDEVSQHAVSEKRIWVTFERGVYDITNFVSEHPGGEQIMLAAGSSVEPFWLLYGVHKNSEILELLETMRIGNVSEEEGKQTTRDMSDPYFNEPRRHAALRPASVKPFNAEPPPSLLVENFITPNELFYVRNHLPVPDVDVSTYELEIEVEGKKKTITLSLEDLKKFPKHTITATIMCAGNRRSEMNQIKMVKGLSWGFAAVGNATWSGARLRDVLKCVGIDDDTEGFNHIQFEGLDMDPTGKSYGGSIPFLKGVDKKGDVILAYEMNGGPIPKDHGYPVRVVVPGVVGARNVKWLGKIMVSASESDSHWQQNDYKGFSPSTDWDTVDFTKSPAIQELPVISAICKPCAEEVVIVKDDCILVQGYAFSGGGQKIVRVDVTADDGKTWHVANLDEQDSASAPQHWGWTLWTAKIPVKSSAKSTVIWAKAVDSSYNTQPESFANIWNLRGVLSNAYHKVPIRLCRQNPETCCYK